MSRLTFVFILAGLLRVFPGTTQEVVDEKTMQQIYEEVRTPYKYGLVMVPSDRKKMLDCPSVFRKGEMWYMTYIVFDGKGYETWLATSADLLNWKTEGRIMSFTQGTWDAVQKAGYIALQDHRWGGSYELQQYNGKYWMSYLGGETSGYEAGVLGVGMAYTEKPWHAAEWQRFEKPVISVNDHDVRWYDKETIYKSSVIRDKKETLGFPFVMFYNAKGINKAAGHARAERIAMAVSSDMIHWKRYGDSPVIDHGKGISGDAMITRIGKVWVMFYFGAFWKSGAFDRFACSYDLKHWTRWEGEDLVRPTEDYDRRYAHKPFVIKYDGTVYHFYCAVDENDNRGIALAVSRDLGKSNLAFTGAGEE